MKNYCLLFVLAVLVVLTGVTLRNNFAAAIGSAGKNSPRVEAIGGDPVPPFPKQVAIGGDPVPPFPKVVAIGGDPVPPFPKRSAKPADAR